MTDVSFIRRMAERLERVWLRRWYRAKRLVARRLDLRLDMSQGPGQVKATADLFTQNARDIDLSLPAPEALVPLYLHLLCGQTKGESGALLDAQAWLTGASCTSSLRA